VYCKYLVVIKIQERLFLWAVKDVFKFQVTGKKEHIKVNVFSNKIKLEKEIKNFHLKCPNIKEDKIAIIEISAESPDRLEMALENALAELTMARNVNNVRIAEFGLEPWKAGWLIRNADALQNYKIQWK
jgi:hypothetical protein